MTELERLQKKVVDTGIVYDACELANYAWVDATGVAITDDVWNDADNAWYKARIELSDYLREYGDELD